MAPCISGAEGALKRVEWQSDLFAPRPLRSRLLALKPTWPCEGLDLRIYRNHSFEHVASAMEPYLAYGGWRARFHYSEYDDSLSFDGLDGVNPHAELVWLDYEHYRQRLGIPGLVNWLGDRLEVLRALGASPILVSNWASMESEAQDFNARLAEVVRTLAGVRVVDLRPLVERLGERYFDGRAAGWSGTRMSDTACLLAARELALRGLPEILRPRLKAVALDLDQTLYKGVVGEDGPEGVELTSGHADLQRRLCVLHSQGVFLALVSRNERQDVEDLFARRGDFPLRWDHFSTTAIGWSEKGDGLLRVADDLRIGLDAMVFIDDNPGELAAIAQAYPQLHLIHADEDATLTERVLASYPGLWSRTSGEVDDLRVADLEAGERRKRLQEGLDHREYHRSLQVRLSFAVDARDQMSRSAELSQKTNQFNLNLRRLGEVEVSRRLTSDTHRIVNARLSDRLADSGVIGLIVGRWEGSVLVIEELCISCRALGRCLEDQIVRQAIQSIVAGRSTDRVDFEFQTGPRNEPARNWLERMSGHALPLAGRVTAPHEFWRIGPDFNPSAVQGEIVDETQGNRAKCLHAVL